MIISPINNSVNKQGFIPAISLKKKKQALFPAVSPIIIDNNTLGIEGLAPAKL